MMLSETNQNRWDQLWWDYKRAHNKDRGTYFYILYFDCFFEFMTMNTLCEII